MEQIKEIFDTLNAIVWGWPMLIMLVGAGVFLSFRLRFLTIFKLGKSFKLLWAGRSTDAAEGHISPFQALMTAMSGTVGTGNIAGVATAVFLGGPGALFWMWITALLGMATSYSEAVLAIKFREKQADNCYRGGPMYYIKNGMGKKWNWLGTAFAIFAAIACIGTGDSIQANSIANVIEANFNVPPLLTGLVVMVCVGLVVIGGIERIGQIAGTLVPFMTMTYITCGVVIMYIYSSDLADAVALVVTSAFSPTAATGGFAGSTMMLAIRFGVARGVFSNEAGLGSAPIAHSSAKTKEPVEQGLIAMLGTFLDTVVVCSITGLSIILTGVWDSGISGAALTANAFAVALPGVGNYIISIGLALFAFTTIIGWSYYGERCIEFVFGKKAVWIYRIIYVLVIPLGATMDLGLIWLISDTMNALMAIPNLIALFILSPVVVKLTKDYFNKI